jgi:hypothetical protein
MGIVVMISGVLLAAIAAAVTLYTWFFVLQVPFDRPVAPLFSSKPASNEGWAPFYIAPIVAAAIAAGVHYRFLSKPKRMTVMGLTRSGAGMALIGVFAAYLVKNIGYTWYFVPGGVTIFHILGALVPMSQFALGRAVGTLITHPLLLFLPALAGSVLAIAARLPMDRTSAEALETAHRPD